MGCCVAHWKREWCGWGHGTTDVDGDGEVAGDVKGRTDIQRKCFSTFINFSVIGKMIVRNCKAHVASEEMERDKQGVKLEQRQLYLYAPRRGARSYTKDVVEFAHQGGYRTGWMTGPRRGPSRSGALVSSCFSAKR